MNFIATKPYWRKYRAIPGMSLMRHTTVRNTLLNNDHDVGIMVAISRYTHDFLTEKVFEATDYESLAHYLKLIHENTPESYNMRPMLKTVRYGNNKILWCSIATENWRNFGVAIFLVIKSDIREQLKELERCIQIDYHDNLRHRRNCYDVLPKTRPRFRLRFTDLLENIPHTPHLRSCPEYGSCGVFHFSTVRNYLFDHELYVKMIAVLPKYYSRSFPVEALQRIGYDSLTKILTIIHQVTPELQNEIPKLTTLLCKDKKVLWCSITTKNWLEIGVGVVWIIEGHRDKVEEFERNIQIEYLRSCLHRPNYYLIVPKMLVDISRFNLLNLLVSKPDWQQAKSRHGSLMRYATIPNTIFRNGKDNTIIVVVPKYTSDLHLQQTFEATDYESLAQALKSIQEDTPEIMNIIPELRTLRCRNDSVLWLSITTERWRHNGVGLFLIINSNRGTYFLKKLEAQIKCEFEFNTCFGEDRYFETVPKIFGHPISDFF